MQAEPIPLATPDGPLQLLLFVDRRTSSQNQARQVKHYVDGLNLMDQLQLQVVDVAEQPHLAEHFRLVATPTLIKVQPAPVHTLTGSDLVAQLRYWIPQWRQQVERTPREEALFDSSYTEGSWKDSSQSTASYREDFWTEAQPSESSLSAHPNSAHPNSAQPNSASTQLSPALGGDPSGLGEGAATKRDLWVEVPASLGARLGRSANPSSLQDVARDSDLIRLRDQVFQLQRTQENLENQLKLKDQIIAMLAHDLRNPLTATAIALETLEMSHSEESGWSSRLSPALTAQILRNARTQTQTIDRMVTEILQTARGSQTGMQLNPSTLDVCNLCRVAIASLGEQFERKSQTLQLDLPQDMPVVLADGEQVRQVLLNLLDNASKYTPNGGEISVSVLHRTTQKVQISIADTGPGIPPENRDHIFEDRFRLERDVSQDGYGIGLSFCQRIIQAHYGQIWVDPLPQGSCFRFTLPVFKP